MKKLFYTLLGVVLIQNVWAFQSNSGKKSSKETLFTLTARFENCSAADSLVLFISEGLYQKTIASAKANKEGVFTLSFPKTAQPALYSVSLNGDPKNAKALILGTENNIILRGPCYSMALINIEGSKLNAELASAMAANDSLKIETGALNGRYQRDMYNEAARQQIEKEFGEVDKKKIALLTEWQRKNPFIGHILAIDMYTSYFHSPVKSQYNDEVSYFIERYFQYADLKNEAYNQIPTLTETMRNYMGVVGLPQLGLSASDQAAIIDNVLKQFKPNSRAYKLAFAGAVLACLETQNPTLVTLGGRYLSEYPNDDATMRLQLSAAIGQAKSSMTGVPAPEIVQADTLGQMRSLSSLKGKVVLIDFWASWCGPCRRENPNVVALYEKYKGKGFDIFSVSLDQNRERWIQAIKDDKLVWPNHVSDLKFWQNEAAKLYNVTSIPRTVLIDKNGIIIGQNLRGSSLENKLKEVFGE